MENKFALRKLKEKDALFMYEWMHDDDVVENLKTDFKSKTIEDCKKFITKSINDVRNINYAIVNENDEYLGTVSLKDVDLVCSNAEFAITIRKKAMGTGCSTYAIKEIIRIGFEELNLKHIYWYVDKKNVRAIKFYDKNGYRRSDFNNIVNICYNARNNYDENYIWYIETKQKIILE